MYCSGPWNLQPLQYCYRTSSYNSSCFITLKFVLTEGNGGEKLSNSTTSKEIFAIKSVFASFQFHLKKLKYSWLNVEMWYLTLANASILSGTSRNAEKACPAFRNCWLWWSFCNNTALLRYKHDCRAIVHVTCIEWSC